MSEISKDVLSDPLALFRQFEIIEDPRVDRHKHYPLLNILVFAFDVEWLSSFIKFTSNLRCWLFSVFQAF
jgi:hypothetical protein